MLAAVGLGVAKEEDLAGWVATGDLCTRHEPVAADRAVYDRIFPEYVALYAALRPRFAALAALGERA